MAAMMNMNLLFGMSMSAFDQTHNVCEILEAIAPNVGELHLFKEDIPEVCMGRKSRFFIFSRCFNFV
jgi:hypothetical protein